MFLKRLKLSKIQWIALGLLLLTGLLIFFKGGESGDLSSTGSDSPAKDRGRTSKSPADSLFTKASEEFEKKKKRASTLGKQVELAYDFSREYGHLHTKEWAEWARLHLSESDQLQLIGIVASNIVGEREHMLKTKSRISELLSSDIVSKSERNQNVVIGSSETFLASTGKPDAVMEFLRSNRVSSSEAIARCMSSMAPDSPLKVIEAVEASPDSIKDGLSQNREYCAAVAKSLAYKVGGRRALEWAGGETRPLECFKAASGDALNIWMEKDNDAAVQFVDSSPVLTPPQREWAKSLVSKFDKR